MPQCGSQIILCNFPIRFDTYEGCSHGCVYCFAKRRKGIAVVNKGEGVEALKNFINHKRNMNTRWCDWDIPLHWGGMSDPFQPIEKEKEYSYEALKVFKETQYPFIFSTKGALAFTDKYLEMFGQCNCVGQVSMVSPKFDKNETGAPTFEQRMDGLSKLSTAVKRLIVRVSPYCIGLLNDVIDNIPRYKAAGVYGLSVEGMKRVTKYPGMEKLAGDYVYPERELRFDFEKIKEACHNNGLKFFSAENRLRSMSDSRSCCMGEMEGFVPNKANLNYDPIEYTPAMDNPGSSYPFLLLGQNTVLKRVTDKGTYREFMEIVRRSSLRDIVK